MNATLVALGVFVLMLGGSGAGTLLRSILPAHHLSDETKDMVKVAIGFLATLAALVLGLLIATAKESFDTKTEEVRASGAKIIQLDHSLRQFGPEGVALRPLLRKLVAAGVDLAWIERDAFVAPAGPAQRIGIEEFQDRLLALSPANDMQRLVRERALQLTYDLSNTRWLLVGQSQSSIPGQFLIVLMFWLFTISTALSLFARRNGTLVALQVLCAASIAGALFLILEMDQPFDGYIKIPDSAMRAALARIGE